MEYKVGVVTVDIMDFRYLDYMHDISDFFTKIQKAEEPVEVVIMGGEMQCQIKYLNYKKWRLTKAK